MGRGRGRGRGFGYGQGYGRGWGRGMRGMPGYSPFSGPQANWDNLTLEEEESMLLDYKAYLESELRMVEERLKEIRRMKGNG